MKFIYINDRINPTTGYVVNIDKGDTLSSFQRLVEGYITVPPVTNQLAVNGVAGKNQMVDVVANDDGLFSDDFTINRIASYLCGQTIVGPVVLSIANTMTGETVGFTDEQIDRLFAQTGNISMLSYNGDEGWSVDALTQFISDRERARA